MATTLRAASALDRLTDETNEWFRAVGAEEAGRLQVAVVHYLRDAVERARDGSLLKAALSCSGAARCLEGLKHHVRARELYCEAAEIYRAHADQSISTSLRECVWSLQQAYKQFVKAGKAEEAKEAYGNLRAIQTRVDYFARGADLPPPPEDGPDPPLPAGAPPGTVDPEIEKAIAELTNEFLMVTRSKSATPKEA